MRSSHRDRDDGAREVDLDACAPVAETLDAQMRKIEIDERVKLFEIRIRRPRISPNSVSGAQKRVYRLNAPFILSLLRILFAVQQ